MKSTVNGIFLESYLCKVILEIKGFAVFMMDTKGIICTWNAGCEALKGFTAEEAIGKHYKTLFPGFLNDKEMPVRELEEATLNGRYDTEDWRIKKTGELFWAYVVLTKVLDDEGNHIGFCKIMQDYSEKKKVEMELKQKNQMLRATNLDLDNFVYTASHDLQAPLTNLQGLISILETRLTEPLQGEPPIEEVLKFMKGSVINLRSVIAEMATTGVIQAEETQKNQQSFKEILEEVKKGLQDEISHTQAQITEEITEPFINFPKKNLRSILYNLISNSIKYRSSERTPIILFSTKKEGAYIVLRISDNGIGIKEQDKKKVFSLYQRLDNAASDVEGTGVGMAIVARIVDGSGGKIEIESEVGKGSTFHIYLKN